MVGALYCKAQTVGQHGWAGHLWPTVTLKAFLKNYLPQLTALESSGNNCHVVGEIRFYRQTYTLTDVVNLIQPIPLDETKTQALKKNWESKGDPKEPHTHKKNHCSTLR
jgi:hypothetical protein